MAARRRCSPWPGYSGAVERAQMLLRASSSHNGPNAPKSEQKEAESSGEVGATPASDSRRTTASHLGRAYATAYRGEGECDGGLGVEVEALARAAVSGGAFSGDGAGGAATAAAALADRGRREGGAGDRVEWSGLGARGSVPTR